MANYPTTTLTSGVCTSADWYFPVLMLGVILHKVGVIIFSPIPTRTQVLVLTLSALSSTTFK